MLLLLLGFQTLETQAWCSEEDTDPFSLQVSDPNFSPMVEFALQKFNQQSEDQYAYKLVSVLSYESKKVSDHLLSHLALCVCNLVREEGCIVSESWLNICCPYSSKTKANSVSILVLDKV